MQGALATLFSHTDGCLYGLVNNAAYGQTGAIEDLSTDLLRAQFETNFFGWHELTRRVIPVMRSAGGLESFRSAQFSVSCRCRSVAHTTPASMHSKATVTHCVWSLPAPECRCRWHYPARFKVSFAPTRNRVFHENIDIEHSHFSRVYKRILKALDRNRGEVMFSLPPHARGHAMW